MLDLFIFIAIVMSFIIMGKIFSIITNAHKNNKLLEKEKDNKTIIERLTNKKENIRSNIYNIKELINISINLDTNSISKLIEKQNYILNYLLVYYKDYSLALSSKNIEIDSKKYIEKYKIDNDYSEYYASMMNSISENYNQLDSDDLIKDKSDIKKMKDKYQNIINNIMNQIILENTNSIIKSLSPIDDKHQISQIVFDSLKSTIDVSSIDESFDRFIAEQNI